MAKILMQPMGLEVVGLFELPLHWCSCSPKRLTANGFSWFICGGSSLLPLLSLLCSIGLRAILTNFRCLHSPTATLDIRCWGAVLVQHSGEGLFWRLHFSSTRISIQTIYLVRSGWWTFHIPFEVLLMTLIRLFSSHRSWFKDKEYLVRYHHSQPINGSGFLLVAFRIAGSYAEREKQLLTLSSICYPDAC